MNRSCMLALAVLLLPPCALADGPAPAAALQSDGRGVRASDRTVDIQHLALDLVVDVVGGRIEGSASLTLTPLRDGLREVRLHAVALDVSGVTVDGAPAGFRVLPEQLVVTLPGPSVAGTVHEVAVTYAARPQLGLHFRAPGPDSPDTYLEAWSQGEDVDNRHWFPSWDEPNDRFTYQGRFTVADRFVAVSNGRLLSKQPATRPGWTTWTYALNGQDLVTYLVMFAAAEYRLISERWRDRPLITYLPPDADVDAGRQVVARVSEMLDFMSDVTGAEYPYPGYSQVFVQRFLYSGMENTTATVMERKLLHPPELAPHARWTESVLAHELAHQWFGDQLTTRDWSHMWLNEGITTFLEGWWWLHAHGPEMWADLMFDRVQRVIKADRAAPRPLVVEFFSRDGDRQSNNAYMRGSALMNGLRGLLGDEDFGRAFRLYVSRHQHGMVTTADVQRAFEDSSGLELSWYFQQWAYLAGHPKLTVRHAWDAEQGSLRVELAQTQKVEGNVPVFVLPVDVVVGTEAGPQRHRVWMDGLAAALVLDLPGPPQWVAVDPDGALLADIAQTQSDDEWAALLRSDAPPYARRLGWAALGTRESPPSDALRALVTGVLMDGGTHPVWRRLAVEALGAWKDDASARALVDALGSVGGAAGPGAPGIGEDTVLQEAIAEQLGTQKRTPAIVAALRALHGRGGNLFVTGAALAALGTVSEEDGLALARQELTKPPGHNERRWRYAIELLGAHGDRKDLDRLARFRELAMEHGTRTRALWASAKIANRQDTAKQRDEARAVVARDAERGLADRNLRGVQTAAALLGQVGDEASIAALIAARSACTVEAVRGGMTRSIEAIRGRKDKDPEPGAEGELTAQVKALQERIDELAGQLKDLQERR
jgi:aminopeptidase N